MIIILYTILSEKITGGPSSHTLNIDPRLKLLGNKE